MRGFRVFAILSAAMIASVGFGQVKPEFKEGASNDYRIVYRMSLSGTDVDVTTEQTIEVREVKEGAPTLVARTRSLTISLMGEIMDPAPPADDMVAQWTADGRVQSVRGGIDGVNVVRLFLTTQFFAPQRTLEKGETDKREFEAITGLPKFTVEVTYEGEESRGVHKFTQKIAEDGRYGFRSESTIWVRTDGTIERLEGKFQNLPIEIAGLDADGTVRMERKA